MGKYYTDNWEIFYQPQIANIQEIIILSSEKNESICLEVSLFYHEDWRLLSVLLFQKHVTVSLFYISTEMKFIIHSV